MDNKTRIPTSECLTCHYKMDATQPAFGKARKPRIDDISVCGKCGTVTKFDENFNMVPLTASELREIEVEDPECHKQITMVQRAIQSRIKRN